MATMLELQPPPPLPAAAHRLTTPFPSPSHQLTSRGRGHSLSCKARTVNIKSYASNNELAVMPRDRGIRLEWDRRYLSVLGVENEFAEESDRGQVMDSFRVNKVAG